MSSNKVWFVTGAARGFGRRWTEAALERGDLVAATARNAKALDELTRKYGDSVLPLALDVTDQERVFEAVQEAHKHFGRLDVILSNAGYGLMGVIEEVTLEDIRGNFETNVFGTVSVIQAALPLLRAQGHGHILLVSSLGGIVAVPGAGIYEGTKFAIEGIGEALASEVARFGIKVTIIEPGPYATDFQNDSSLKKSAEIPAYDSVREDLAKWMPEGLMGDPAATPKAILKLVDVENPPLRLVLGNLIPMVKQAYEQRLQVWESWQAVSDEAQGK